MKTIRFVSATLAVLILTLTACAAQTEGGIDNGTTDPVASTQMPKSEPEIGGPEEPDSGDKPLSATVPAPYPLQGLEGGGEDLIRGEAQLETAELELSSTQLQVEVNLVGTLPNPCYQLRVRIEKSDQQGQINLEVYGEASAGEICTQVLAPFEESVNITPASPGVYTVRVNGEAIGGFTLASGGVYP